MTVITASHSNLDGLKELYDCLKPHLSANLVWRIQDTGKCVDTGLFFKRLENKFVFFDNSGDTGIYNALNIALKNVGQYYLVCGSDDTLSDALFVFLAELSSLDYGNLPDLIALSVNVEGKVKAPGKFYWMSVSLRGYIATHSVGTIIRSTLHDKVGMYSENYKILSDSLFLSKCYQIGCKREVFSQIIAGKFGTQGVSSTEINLRAQEAYRYHLELGYNRGFQAFLKIARLVKFYLSSSQQHKQQSSYSDTNFK